MLGKLSYFTNLNLKAIWGWFLLLTIISRVGLQWGRDEIYPNNMYAGEWRWWTCNFIQNTHLPVKNLPGETHVVPLLAVWNKHTFILSPICFWDDGDSLLLCRTVSTVSTVKVIPRNFERTMLTRDSLQSVRSCPIAIGSMVLLYMVTFTIYIPQMLAYINHIYHTWILWDSWDFWISGLRFLIWVVLDEALWKIMEWKSVGIMTFPTEWKKTVPNHPAVMGKNICE